jgi:hypothetical protein
LTVKKDPPSPSDTATLDAMDWQDLLAPKTLVLVAAAAAVVGVGYI